MISKPQIFTKLCPLLQHAHTHSTGFFITQDSSFGNLILPVIPRLEPESSWPFYLSSSTCCLVWDKASIQYVHHDSPIFSLLSLQLRTFVCHVVNDVRRVWICHFYIFQTNKLAAEFRKAFITVERRFQIAVKLYRKPVKVILLCCLSPHSSIKCTFCQGFYICNEFV